MASNAKRRAKEAAERGGGLLSFGRSESAGAMDENALASQLQAGQALDRLNTPANDNALAPVFQFRPVKRPAQTRKETKGLIGAKPNPLPAGLDMSARFAAGQQQDRMAAQNDQGTSDANADTFLEIQHAPRTGEEAEAQRERRMEQTKASLMSPGGGAESPAQEEEEPGQTISSEDGSSEPQESSAASSVEATGDVVEEEVAADLASQQAQDARQQAAAQQASVTGAASQAQQLIEANKNVRTVIKAVQAAGAESILTIFTLWIQINLETLNKWIFHIRIPYVIEPEKDPQLGVNDVATGCVNITCCFGCLPMAIFLFVFTFAFIWLATTDPIGFIFEFIKSAFRGTFG